MCRGSRRLCPWKGRGRETTQTKFVQLSLCECFLFVCADAVAASPFTSSLAAYQTFMSRYRGSGGGRQQTSTSFENTRLVYRHQQRLTSAGTLQKPPRKRGFSGMCWSNSATLASVQERLTRQKQDTCGSQWKRQQMSSYATPQTHTHTDAHTQGVCVTADGVRRGDGGAATGTAFRRGSGGWRLFLKLRQAADNFAVTFIGRRK